MVTTASVAIRAILLLLIGRPSVFSLKSSLVPAAATVGPHAGVLNR
jgi:hypothetical protein